MQFPSAAQYPAPGLEPPIITSCVSYAAQPCDSTVLTHLGYITFDATRPTVTITKVSEQYGDPTASTTRRKLQQTTPSQPLFALLLFNFSKPGVVQISSLHMLLLVVFLPSPSDRPCQFQNFCREHLLCF